MNKLALLAAILFTLVSGRSAEAITIFSDYFFLYTPTGSSTVTASGEFTVDPTFRELLSATGDINGSPITGVSGSFPEFPGTQFNFGFYTSTGSNRFQAQRTISLAWTRMCRRG